MNRRDALITTGSMLVSASLGALACGGNNAVAQNTPKAPPAPAPAGGHAHHGGDPALFEAAQACLAKGEACVAHCLAMLASGDASMGGCAKSVHEMRSVMQGLATAAASGSKHLPALAKVAMEFCKDCEVECRRHADKHVACKDCLDACTRTIAACQKVAG
ncbi:MAG: Csp1 family four helix bundle copper storage protein [Labilithrix sp.]|nr:Csp1 family four helix bundle copper storage protein [Labilithrix sp.]